MLPKDLKDTVSIRFPPYLDIDYEDFFRSINFSQFDFDWEFFYSIVFVKLKNNILEVRPVNTYRPGVT